MAYNRPHALRRLLATVETAVYPPNTPLILSIDAGGDTAVRQIAQTFNWIHGPKELIIHPQRLGLVRHFYACGDLTRQFGAIILLEDDLIVAPHFYTYAVNALSTYANDPQIAGISLNALWFNGFRRLPFTPWPVEGDVFFLQVPWYQGQAYTADQWQRFTNWRETADTHIYPHDPIHEMYTQFATDEWFPLKAKYLAENNLFYVFPRYSLTTNFGDQGTHFQQVTNFFQVPLQIHPRNWHFTPRSETTAVYDSFFEQLPDRFNRLTPILAEYDYTVDLYATKTPTKITTPYVLTTRPCRQAEHQFGMTMRPLAANVIWQVPGTGISLTRREELQYGRKAEWTIEARLAAYFGRHCQMGWRRAWRLRIWQWWLRGRYG